MKSFFLRLVSYILLLCCLTGCQSDELYSARSVIVLDISYNRSLSILDDEKDVIDEISNFETKKIDLDGSIDELRAQLFNTEEENPFFNSYKESILLNSKSKKLLLTFPNSLSFIHSSNLNTPIYKVNERYYRPTEFQNSYYLEGSDLSKYMTDNIIDIAIKVKFNFFVYFDKNFLKKDQPYLGCRTQLIAYNKKGREILNKSIDVVFKNPSKLNYKIGLDYIINNSTELQSLRNMAIHEIFTQFTKNNCFFNFLIFTQKLYCFCYVFIFLYSLTKISP